MNFLDFINRYKWWLILAILLTLNAVHYWHSKPAPAPAAPAPPRVTMGSDGFPAIPADVQARIDALPPDQKQAVQDRIQRDKDFFTSIQSLPASDRMQKAMDYFAQNPPPPVLMPQAPAGGPPGGGAGGGPGGQPGGNGFPGAKGDGGAPPIPPPEVRRQFEQGFVNMMRNAQSQNQ